MPIKIVYEDNHLLAVIKPHGMVSQADEHHVHALDTEMKEWIKKRDNKPGNVFLTPIHRLDKAASGIVIFAKTSKALARMHEAMRERKIEKTYWALLETIPPEESGVLVHYLDHDLHRAKVVKKESRGKRSELAYKLIRKEKGKGWVEVDLVTGRYHQIRAQFAEIGCPVVGDTRYGAHGRLPNEAIALYHVKIRFSHPTTGQSLCLEHPDFHALKDVFLDRQLGRA